MADVSPSRTISLSRKHSKLNGGLSSKHMYDDVFSSASHPTTLKSSTFALPVEDYSEIFGASRNASASSIPILDLPEPDIRREEVRIARNSGAVDYAGIFAGFGDDCLGPSFDDLADQSKQKEESPFQKPRNGAETKMHSKVPDVSYHSGNDQGSINGSSFQPPDTVSRVNVSYNKVNQTGNHGANGMTHIAQLHAVPGFTYVVDDVVSPIKGECAGKAAVEMDNEKGSINPGRRKKQRNLSKENMRNTSFKSHSLSGEVVPPRNNACLDPAAAKLENGSGSINVEAGKKQRRPSMEDICDADKQKQCFIVPPQPSASKSVLSNVDSLKPVNRGVGGSDSDIDRGKTDRISTDDINAGVETCAGKKHKTLSKGDVNVDTSSPAHPSATSPSTPNDCSFHRSKKYSFRRFDSDTRRDPNGDSSPPFLEEEIDFNSAAAVSAAAMKKAIEEAETQIRLAKELLERKMGASSATLSFKDSLKVKPISKDKRAKMENKVREKQMRETNAWLGTSTKISSDLNPENRTTANLSLGFEDRTKLEGAEPMCKTYDRETDHNHEGGRGGGEWEAAKQLSQLFSGVKNRLVNFMSKQADSEKNMMQKDKTCGECMEQDDEVTWKLKNKEDNQTEIQRKRQDEETTWKMKDEEDTEKEIPRKSFTVSWAGNREWNPFKIGPVSEVNEPVANVLNESVPFEQDKDSEGFRPASSFESDVRMQDLLDREIEADQGEVQQQYTQENQRNQKTSDSMRDGSKQEEALEQYQESSGDVSESNCLEPVNDNDQVEVQQQCKQENQRKQKTSDSVRDGSKQEEALEQYQENTGDVSERNCLEPVNDNESVDTCKKDDPRSGKDIYFVEVKEVLEGNEDESLNEVIGMGDEEMSKGDTCDRGSSEESQSTDPELVEHDEVEEGQQQVNNDVEEGQQQVNNDVEEEKQQVNNDIDEGQQQVNNVVEEAQQQVISEACETELHLTEETFEDAEGGKEADDFLDTASADGSVDDSDIYIDAERNYLPNDQNEEAAEEVPVADEALENETCAATADDVDKLAETLPERTGRVVDAHDQSNHDIEQGDFEVDSCVSSTSDAPEEDDEVFEKAPADVCAPIESFSGEDKSKLEVVMSPLEPKDRKQEIPSVRLINEALKKELLRRPIWTPDPMVLSQLHKEQRDIDVVFQSESTCGLQSENEGNLGQHHDNDENIIGSEVDFNLETKVEMSGHESSVEANARDTCAPSNKGAVKHEPADETNLGPTDAALDHGEEKHESLEKENVRNAEAVNSSSEKQSAEAARRRRRWFKSQEEAEAAKIPSLFEGIGVTSEMHLKPAEVKESMHEVEASANDLVDGFEDPKNSGDAGSDQDGGKKRAEAAHKRKRWFEKEGEGVVPLPGLFEGNQTNAVDDDSRSRSNVDDSLEDCMRNFSSEPEENENVNDGHIQEARQNHGTTPRRKRWFDNGGTVGPTQQRPNIFERASGGSEETETRESARSDKHDETLAAKEKADADANTNKRNGSRKDMDEVNRGEREKERERLAVERAIREARERAFVEARDKAERAAIEKATAEIRQKGATAAQDRTVKASGETSSQLDKAFMEAKLRVERAAVERATAEARERALQKAMSEKTASKSRELGGRSSSMDPKHQNSSANTRSSSHASVSYASERSDGNQGETTERHKAVSEMNKRTMERAAKALEEKNMRDLLAQKERAERNRYADALDAEVKRWCSGREGNLRALISTLHYVLGADCGWQPISLIDLVSSTAVRKAYKKATLCVHPDKLQQRGASVQHKYICEKVFDLLKEAWHRFNPDER